ncbi:unnamed protein product [Amoebophrya sp. A120]|nr:unnamed protein product [Amoebophrya sp. A120]|eukprot:GSA120T00019674001.1
MSTLLITNLHDDTPLTLGSREKTSSSKSKVSALPTFRECEEDEEEDFFEPTPAPPDFDGLKARSAAVATAVAAKGANPSDRWHVIFVIDTSGSMGKADIKHDSDGASATKNTKTKTRLRAVLEVLEDFAEHQRDTDRAASGDLYSAVGFSDESTVWFQSVKSGDELCDSLRIAQSSGRARARNGTSYTSGLYGAMQLHKSRPDLKNRKVRIIFLSDGRPQTWDRYDAQWYQETCVPSFPKGVQLHCVGIGKNTHAFACLQHMAVLGGGRFYFSQLAAADLRRTFTTISRTLTSTRESGGSSSTKDSSAKPRAFTFLPPPKEVLLYNTKMTEPNMGYPAGNVDVFHCSRDQYAFDLEFGMVHTDHTPLTWLQRATLPFTKGNMRFVFAMKGDDDFHANEGNRKNFGKLLVGKETFAATSTYETQMTFVRNTCVAQYFARGFCDRIGVPEYLRFLPVFLYSRPPPVSSKKNKKKQKNKDPTDEKQVQFFCGEEYLPGIFEKVTNNADYVKECAAGDANRIHTEALECFSHFTYEESGGSLMVTDLQGVASQGRDLCWTLTDPQVLSQEPGRELYGRADRGPQGMTEFFSRHKCNEMCRRLDLPSREEEFRTLAASGLAVVTKAKNRREEMERKMNETEESGKRATLAASSVSSSVNEPSRPKKKTRSTLPGERENILSLIFGKKLHLFGECDCSFTLAAAKLCASHARNRGNFGNANALGEMNDDGTTQPMLTNGWVASDLAFPVGTASFEENSKILKNHYGVTVVSHKSVDASKPILSAKHLQYSVKVADIALWAMPFLDRFSPALDSRGDQQKMKKEMQDRIFGFVRAQGDFFDQVAVVLLSKQHLDWELRKALETVGLKQKLYPIVKVVSLQPLLDHGYQPHFGDKRDTGGKKAKYHKLCECVVVSWSASNPKNCCEQEHDGEADHRGGAVGGKKDRSIRDEQDCSPAEVRTTSLPCKKTTSGISDTKLVRRRKSVSTGVGKK